MLFMKRCWFGDVWVGTWSVLGLLSGLGILFVDAGPSLASDNY